MPSWPSREAMEIAASAASWSSAAGAKAGARHRGCWPCRGGSRCDQFGQPGASSSSSAGARGGTERRPICQARSASTRSPPSMRSIAAGLPTDIGKPLGAAESWNAADTRLGQSEPATVGGHHQVTREHQLEAAAESVAVDFGDDRHDDVAMAVMVRCPAWMKAWASSTPSPRISSRSAPALNAFSPLPRMTRRHRLSCCTPSTGRIESRNTCEFSALS